MLDRLDALFFPHRAALVLLAATPVIVAPFWRTPHLSQVAVGAAIVLCGVALRLEAVRWIGKRARVHHAGAATLLVAGPYAYVRNPIYIANLLILLGIGVGHGLGALAIAPALLTLFTYDRVVRHEERALAELFGEGYKTYLAAVSRWIPGFRAVPGLGDPATPPVSWGEVFWRESGALLGIAVWGATIVLVAVSPTALAVLRAPAAFVGRALGVSAAAVVLAGVLAAVAIQARGVGLRSAKRARRKAKREAREAAAAAALLSPPRGAEAAPRSA